MGCSDSNSLQINQANLGGNSPLPYNANAVYNQNGQYNVNYVNNPNYQINNENNSNVYNTNYANHNKNVNNKKSSNVGSNQLKNQIENYTNNISLQRDVKSVKNNTNKNGENFIEDDEISNCCYFEKDDFEDSDYFSVFKPNFYEKHIQNFTKVFSDLQDEDGDKVHQISITLNYRDNEINIVEIEKTLDSEYTKHLRVSKIENKCSLEKARPFLEKYNSHFQIDSSQWYNINNATDIYVKAEIDSEGFLSMFEITYDKESYKLSFKKKDTKTNFFFKSDPEFANPMAVVMNYNILKSVFTVDHFAEEFKLPKNNFNFGNNLGNNMISSMKFGINIQQTINIKIPQNKRNNNGNNKGKGKDNDNGNDSNPVCKVDSYGRRYKDGNYVGRFDSDGYAYDEEGYREGKIDDDGYIKDADGYTKLKVEDGGYVKDADGYIIGQVKDGVVRDKDGYKIGEYDNDNPNQAAYQHFFKND